MDTDTLEELTSHDSNWDNIGLEDIMKVTQPMHAIDYTQIFVDQDWFCDISRHYAIPVFLVGALQGDE